MTRRLASHKFAIAISEISEVQSGTANRGEAGYRLSSNSPAKNGLLFRGLYGLILSAGIMSSLWAVVAGSFCKPTATFDFTGSLSAPFYLFTAAFGAICAAVVLLTGYSSAASLLASLAMIGILWPLAGPARSAYGLASALLIVVMHRENIARLRAGTENKLPLFGRGGG